VLAGIAVTTDPNVWSESQGWPQIAQLVAGNWLGFTLASAALISTWALFNSQLLYVSRLPYVMARDKWLPTILARLSQRTGVPVAALLASCSVAAVCSALSFGKLVLIDVLLYSVALSLEFVAFFVLRLQRPDMPRPFRVPGGWLGVALTALAPLSCVAVLIFASFQAEGGNTRQLLIVCGAIISGVAVYFIRRPKAAS